MSNKRVSLALMVLISTMMGLNAQEEVRNLGEYVVTGNKYAVPIEKSGKVIYKITKEDIQRSNGQTVAQLINSLPGINVDGVFGAPGSNLSYNLRGGRNRHTLILIDGLPINDPSSIANDYDLRLLNASSVEYIEVLKGGASTLYGTGAASGVINIKLKEANSEDAPITLSQNVGSFQSANTNADFQGATGKWKYLASGGFSVSEGFSAAEDNNPTLEYGNDGFFRYSGRTRFNYQASEKFEIEANLSYEQVQADYDDGAFLDADNEFTIKQVSYGLNPKLDYSGGQLQLKFNHNRIKRAFESAFPSTARGENTQIDLTNEFLFNDKIKAIAGIQFQKYKFESGTEEPNQSNFDPYLNISADLTEALSLTAGVRLNNNSEYGNNLVYSVNPSYLINLNKESQLKIFGSYSTAFVAPSLFQLFADFFGNANLQAEETKSLEFGFSLYLSKDLTLNAEYFDRTEENAIDFVSQFDNNGVFVGGSYENVVGKREIDGIELDLDWRVSENLTLTGHYADYNFVDPTQFYRIPSQKYGLNALYNIGVNTRIGLNYNHFGERMAAIFSDPFLVTLNGYDLVDLSINHTLFDGDVILSGAINNILDEDFVGVYGFGTTPVNFNIGVTAKF